MNNANCPNCGKFMTKDMTDARMKDGKVYRSRKCPCGGELLVEEVKA